MSDPLEEIKKQIDILWKELTTIQQTQPLPYLINMVVPPLASSQIIPSNQKVATGIENGVKLTLGLGNMNPDGSLQPSILSTILGSDNIANPPISITRIPESITYLKALDESGVTSLPLSMYSAAGIVAGNQPVGNALATASIPFILNGAGTGLRMLQLDTQANIPVNPWFGNTWTTVSGEVTSPGAVSLIADTGALAAGNYDFIITLWTSDLIAVGAREIVQHRNAANAANVNVIGGCGSNDSKSIFYFNYPLAVNERVRVVNGAAGTANSVYGAGIAYRVTS